MAKEEKEKIEIKPAELKKQLAECQKTKEEYLAGWQRTQADFLNYKKEEEERMKELSKYVQEEFVLKILPILDNFEIAISQKNCPREEDRKERQTIQGFIQIKEQLENFLKALGVEKINSKGEMFDPNLHEAVDQVEKEGREAGTIVEEVQKGYKINGRLLRPAKVKVAK